VASPRTKIVVGEATLSLFATKKPLLQGELILPALADPVAAGDPAYPVLYGMLLLG